MIVATRFAAYGDVRTTSTPVLVSQLEAARLLGVERTTIWRMCGRRELDRVRIGSRSLITLASIEAYVRAQVEGSQA